MNGWHADQLCVFVPGSPGSGGMLGGRATGLRVAPLSWAFSLWGLSFVIHKWGWQFLLCRGCQFRETMAMGAL